MRYKELRIETESDNLDTVVETLSVAGFNSLAIDDPEDLRDIEEHPEWYRYDYINEELSRGSGRKPVVTLYFNEDEEGKREAARAEEVLRRLKDYLDSAFEWELSETGDDSEWLYKWQEHFKPTRVGERIVVKPSWENYEAEPEDIVIEMDPGMAFGSGLHETTSLCIKALEKNLRDRDLSRFLKEIDGRSDARLARSEARMQVTAAQRGYKSRLRSESKDLNEHRPFTAAKVLDVGTGTGILAIAAAHLGASECFGIDIDEDAVRVARENVERNGLSGRIRIEKGDLLSSKSTADSASADSDIFEADIIVANLMADLVIRLAPSAAERLKSGGVFISSGILDIKEEIVSEAVRAAGFEITEVLHDGEWCAIIAAKK